MHSTRSHRHQRAAHARWRAAEARAQAERDAGIPDRAAWHDARLPIVLDLRTYGGALLRIEPRPGYVSVRVIDDDTGQVVHCAALKTALHRIAAAAARHEQRGSEQGSAQGHDRISAARPAAMTPAASIAATAATM